jgi:hypothetical protein
MFKRLNEKFQILDLGKTKQLLGMEVTQENDGSITLSQRKYTMDILKRFGMDDCSTVTTPTPPVRM